MDTQKQRQYWINLTRRTILVAKVQGDFHTGWLKLLPQTHQTFLGHPGCLDRSLEPSRTSQESANAELT